MPDFLDVKLREIRDRLNELRPLVEEYRRLEAAEGALSGVRAPDASAPAKQDRTTRRVSRASKKSRAGRGQEKGSGSRAAQALEVVRERPGIAISELAEAMDIEQNYLYRVMPKLAEQGRVQKMGRGWYIRDDSADIEAPTQPEVPAVSDDDEPTSVSDDDEPTSADVSPESHIGDDAASDGEGDGRATAS